MSDAPSTPPNHRKKILIAIAVLLGALIMLIAVEWGSIVGPDQPTSDDAPKSGMLNPPRDPAMIVRDAGPTAARSFASPPEAPAEPVSDSHLAAAVALNDSAGTARRDLEIVAELLQHYLGEFQELPVGNNAEITAALAGDNARAFAILPANHHAINIDGELVDRWGTPYFFHQLASDLMEIRSSGPDRRRYTADDPLWPAANATSADETTTVAVR